MLITIEESAKEYILRKSGERAISISIAKAVYYEQAEVDGIVVYYHPSVAELVGKLTVSLEKLFFMKKLIARATV
ncbi:MAG: hypothetical protein H6Q73_4503 [Firmicutes bacterium]|nr:hypothetical protein [Bacillota bacterium]